MTHAINKKVLRPIVEGDLFLSARSSVFLLSFFPSSLTRNRALKLRFFVGKTMFWVRGRAPGRGEGRGKKEKQKHEKKLKNGK